MERMGGKGRTLNIASLLKYNAIINNVGPNPIPQRIYLSSSYQPAYTPTSDETRLTI